MSNTPDKRIVMTLDAGGTNFRFTAMRGTKPVTETVALPSNGDNLERCLGQHRRGLHPHKDNSAPQPPVAISFAFPAPADYPNGIIGDLWQPAWFPRRRRARANAGKEIRHPHLHQQ